METSIIKELVQLYKKWAGHEPDSIKQLPISGSYRLYYRLYSKRKTFLGVYNNDLKENNAYFSFTHTFRKIGLNVPELIMTGESGKTYLIEDLGDETLFSFISSNKNTDGFSDSLISYYKLIINKLPEFQITGGKLIDYSVCYPRSSFDRQSMMWDLNYFKYYFLKLARVPFDEQKLEDDFTAFTEYLLKAPSDFFMYRDFQSRNIMIKESKPWFIDFQGGRKGALQYDIASLLYDAKAAIPQPVRNDLLDYYIACLKSYFSVDELEFKNFYYGFVLIRIMQAMGAYGFRGYYEKKEHFLQSIPFAVNNLKYLLSTNSQPVVLPELLKVLTTITLMDNWKEIPLKKDVLNIDIYSFSFKNGIPTDHSGNGGGFVFDCRVLPNPGRFEQYINLTGKDKEVIDFLLKEPAVQLFLDNIFNIADLSVNNYLERNFSHLMISFGCTGGRHRSVYCAEQMATHLKEIYKNIHITLTHREIAHL